MARVGRGVDGLLHRAQKHAVNLRRVGPVLGCGSNRRVLPRLRAVADRKSQAQSAQIGLQRHALFGRWAFMNAEQRSVLGFGDVIGRADIGRQHRFFDQFVRFVAGARHDLFDAAVVITDDLRLGGVEVDRAADLALCQQGAVDLVQMHQMRHQGLALGRLRPMRVGKDRSHLGVGEPRMRANHGRVELKGRDFTRVADQHVADHRQPVFVGNQRAQAVGDFLRQHRDHPARKIDRGGTLIGVCVQRLTGLDVVADVGNRHQQAPAAENGLAAAGLVRLAVHRVVEVARIFTVDGDQGYVAQIDATFQVHRTQLLGQLGGLRQGGRAEQVRHLELAHGDLDLHAGIVNLAQHLDDTTDRLRIQRRRLGQLHADHLPRHRIGNRVLGDQDVLPHALVFGCHEPDAGLEQQAADDGLLLARQNLDHAAFGTAAFVIAADSNPQTVTVHDGLHFLRGQVDVLCPDIG